MECPALSHATCKEGKASSLRHHSSGIQTRAAMPGFVHKCWRYKFTPSYVCRQSPKIQWRINREGSPSQPLYKPSQASALIEHTHTKQLLQTTAIIITLRHSKLLSAITIPKQTMTPLYRSLLSKKPWEGQSVWLMWEKPWNGTSVYLIDWGTDVHLNITAQSTTCKPQQCEAIQSRFSMAKMDNGEKNYVGTLYRSFKGWKGSPHHIQSARLRLSVGICLTITSTLKGSC